jgi:xanthine dehydrogenase accessory factor
MPEIYKRMIQELSSGRPVVLAAIISQAGSSPRSLGAKFAVCHDGSLVGSIGGGKLEAQVIKAAEGLMKRGTAIVKKIRMTGKEVAGTDMICGGNVDVLIQGITPGNHHAFEILEEVLLLVTKRRQGILAVGPLPKQGEEAKVGMLLYRPEGKMLGSMGQAKAVLELVRSHAETTLGADTPVIYDSLLGPILMEPISSLQTVIVFGGGHISVNLVPMLTMVDFRVVVVDDRAEFANEKRFPQAAQIVVADYEKSFDQLEFTPETYCVIVTRGHIHDKTVIENVLTRPTRYVGMIGSRRKRDMVYDALMKQGFSSDQLKSVYSPIGLDIGAETAEEIAISIVAELIQIRAHGLRRAD